MKTITAKMKKAEIDDILSMEEDKPYLAKCIMENDDYLQENYYIIEFSTINQKLQIYNTGSINVWNITEISLEPFGVQND